MTAFIVTNSNMIAMWGGLVRPDCERPAHPDSGTHGLCVKHYVKWYNGYAKAYGWTPMKEEDIPQEVVEDA